MWPNAADERASFCMLDPFVSAPLFFLFCALNTGSLHLKLRSFISIRSVSADTVVLFMPLFLICLLFIFILFLRTGNTSLPLRHVCANANRQPTPPQTLECKRKKGYSGSAG
jgi:hypothetical protein